MIDGSRSDSAELLERVFPGDSELARRMRAFNWVATDLGHPSSWPENLRVALAICLTSKFPMNVLWGPSLTLFYNDAYISFLGHGKHPAALGRSFRQVWAEIWPAIGPMIEEVRTTKQASWSADTLMFFERAVSKEEVYVTLSFSPVLGASGVEGLFCACTESTQQIVSNRRLETLRLLSVRATAARTIDVACEMSTDVLAQNSRDVPFAGIYVLESESGVAVLRATSRLPADHTLPKRVALHDSEPTPWPIAAVVEEQRPKARHDLAALGLRVQAGQGAEPIRSALVLPIPSSAPDKAAGILVVGVSPRRPFDASYQSFFELVAGHIGTAIADVQAYEAERERAEGLAELDRAKTAFFTNVSHEFRTPLQLILGPLEDTLARLERCTPQELAAKLEPVRRNAFRLLRLVNALLDFSRIEAGRASAAYEAVDIAGVTADLASTFRSVVENAGLEFTIRCDAVHEPIYLDRTMYEMIVLNLLSNAFKFTHAGSIEVALRSRADDVELSVSDTGIGIARDQLPRVFERFHRIEDARARTHEGAGIGLALVRELVRMHGGEIDIESELGRGTCVRVSLRKGSAHLPADRIAAASSRALRESVASFVEEAARWGPRDAATEYLQLPELGGAPRARVLVVDDNADVRDYLVRVLSAHWSVVTAPNGAVALETLRETSVDLVLTDLMMPSRDGFEFIRALRADPRLAALPIIVITARAGEEARIQGLELGADDYLTKPFSGREVVARVATHLSLNTLRGEVLSSRAKDEFLAILSHELRNPLAPITTAVALLRMRGAHSRELDIIERQTQHLRRLLDDLLDVARIEAGKVELQKEYVEVGSIVERAIDLVLPQVEARRQQLTTEVPGAGLAVIGDPARLAQALSNLIVNAAKFSPPESEIQIQAAAVDGVARLRVRDQGIGLAHDMHGRVFNLFVQQPQAIDRKSGGLGLGLAIARGLVELHGGSLRAVSEGLGRGAELILELPLAAAQLDRRSELSAGEGSELPVIGQERSRVLVVDDNSDSADLLATALSRYGYSVATAYDGVDGLSTAGQFHPDICLLDIGLPRMDGYELARRLRDPTRFPSELRLIAITGYGQAADRQRAVDAGFDAHLTKPVDLERLLGLLESSPHGAT